MFPERLNFTIISDVYIFLDTSHDTPQYPHLYLPAKIVFTVRSFIQHVVVLSFRNQIGSIDFLQYLHLAVSQSQSLSLI